MRPLSEATARVTGKSFSRKHIALGRILNHWTEIVGEKLATKAQPVQLHYRKHEKSKTTEVILDIAVSSADATLLHYQKDLILERMNQIFGDRWVTAIRFVHEAPANAPPLLRKKAKAPLTEDKKKSLSSVLDGVTDEDVKERLSRLGEEVLSKE